MIPNNSLKLPTMYLVMAIILLLSFGCARLGIYRLSLQAVPSEGTAPLIVSFSAEIKGGPNTSPELYCRRQTWDFGDGKMVDVFGLCNSWRPGVKIDRYFRQTHIYEEPGVYEVSVHYGQLDSEPIVLDVSE